MKTKIKYENLTSAERDLADESVAKICDAVARKLPGMAPDLQRLEGHIRKSQKGHLYSASLRLHLPSTVLIVKAERTDLAELFSDARNDLSRQVRRHVARLRHYYELRRHARRDRFAEHMAIDKDERLRRLRAEFFEAVEGHLDLLWNYAWRELSYMAANGDLPPGALSLSDAVDAILLSGALKYEKRPPETNLKDWLYRLCVETLEQEARQISRAIPAKSLALDADVPEPAVDPTEADQEFHEFYQPDDAPTLENLIPFPDEGSAEDVYTKYEIARALHRAMADLPTVWRQAIVLVHLEELPEDRVVEILAISPVELSDILVGARRFLKMKLAHSLDVGEQQEDVSLDDALRATKSVKTNQNAREEIASRYRQDTRQDQNVTAISGDGSKNAEP